MPRGTGLPLPDDNATLQPAGVTSSIDSSIVSNAAAWGQIAHAGAQLRETGADFLERETHKKQVGYLADQEVEIARQRIELHNRFAKDPAGFDRAWTAYSDGKLGDAEPWAVPHLRARLGQEGNSAYSTLLNDKRQHDEALDGRRVRALADQTASDVIGAAMVGTLGTTQGQAKIAKLQAVYDTAVTSGYMTEDEARLQMLEVTSRAGAESTIKAIGDTYKENRAKGLEAGDIALREADTMLLRTADPKLAGLSEELRYAYYHKATAEIRALEAERKQDLAIAKQAKTDAESAMTAGVRVEPDTINDIVQQLERAGGHADAARLRASAVRFDRLQAFGRQPLTEQVRQHQTFSALTTGQSADEAGLAFIRNEEGFTPTAKFDVRQYSVGYGTKGAPGETITREEAERRLRAEVAEVDTFIRENVKVPLTQNQHNALVSFGFNLGTDDIDKLLSDLNAGNFDRVAERMLTFNRVDGVPNSAIARRRAREVELFLRDGPPAAPATAGPGVDYKLLAGQRKIISKEAAELWGKIEKQLDDGLRPQPAELNTLIQAATIGGDYDLLEEVGERLDRLEAGRMAGRGPLAAQQGALTELQAAGATGRLTAAQAAWKRDLETITANTREKLAEDPIALGVERFPERFATPQPLNLTSVDAARAGLAERLGIARFVGENYGQQKIPALSVADRTTLAAAIASPSDTSQQKAGQGAILSHEPNQSAIALDLLAGLPDDFLFPTLETKEIKAAITGAARTADPAKYLATMQALDRIWTRAPLETHRLVGDDGIKALQDWQAKLRYHSPEDVADMLRRRDDPQIREQRKRVENEAHRVLNDSGYDVDDLVDDLDPGWFVTGPDVPVDARTRDQAMADYRMLFVERYAETQDRDTARKQAVERMKLNGWGRSEVNGGQLTLYPPEAYYGAVAGSHDWMKEQIVDELAKRLPTIPEDYRFAADRITQSQITAGEPPSYLVSIKTAAGWELLRDSQQKPVRFFWERQGPAQTARESFEAQRQRVLKADRNAPALTRFIREGVRRLGIEPVITE